MVSKKYRKQIIAFLQDFYCTVNDENITMIYTWYKTDNGHYGKIFTLWQHQRKQGLLTYLNNMRNAKELQEIKFKNKFEGVLNDYIGS